MVTCVALTGVPFIPVVDLAGTAFAAGYYDTLMSEVHNGNPGTGAPIS
jgi:hypothetical protein